MCNFSTIDEWSRPALVSCQILTLIGVYLIFVFIAGILLNVLVLRSLLKTRKSQSPIRIYMIALTFVDLMETILGIPLPLSSNFACRWLYGKYWCFYEGFIAYFVGMTGLYLLTALSMNRYWMIVAPVRAKYVTFQTAYFSVVFAVVGGLFWAVGPLFGWNNYTLEGVLTSCSIRWQGQSTQVKSYNASMFIFAYTIPLFIIIYCNIKIYLEVRHVSARKYLPNKTRTGRRIRLERRIVRTVFLIIGICMFFSHFDFKLNINLPMSFFISWTPYAVVAFISFVSSTVVPPLGGTLPAIFAKSSVYFVPLVCILTNSQMRHNLSTRRSRRSNQRPIS